MASAVVGALRVNLSADTAAFSSGLKNATSGMTSFSANAKRAMAAVAVAVTGVATAIAVGMRRTINEADQLGKTAQKIGIPVEELSRLKHAADLSGVAMGTLQTGVQRLSRNLLDVAQGAGAEARRAFETLGIAVKNTDGSLKSSTQIMQEVAGRFAGMEDGATKTALAMQLFGRSGAELIPMLNAGEAGLAAMMHEADKLGIVIDTKTAKAAERFNDNLTRLGKVKDGIILQLTAHMLPAFERLSQNLIDAAIQGEWVERVSKGLTTVMDGLTRAVILVWDNLDLLRKVAIAFIGIKIGAAVVAAGTAFVAFANAVKLATVTKLAFNAVMALGKTGLVGLAAGAALATSEYFGLTDVTGALANATAGLATQLGDTLHAALAAVGLDTSALTMNLDALAVQFEDDLPASIATFDVALATSGAAATKLAADTKDATEDAEDSLKSLGKVGQEVAERMSMTWQEATISISGSFASIGSAFADSSKKMAILGKAFAIINATISTFEGAAKALTLPFPANLAAAAAVMARGLAFVASIKSQKVPSFASGGSFMVGGKAGIDQNRVMMDVSRGERVTIETPEQQRGNGQIETIRLVSDLDSVYTFDHIRKLVRRLNEYGRDNGMPRLELVST